MEGHGCRSEARGAAVEGYTNFLWTLWMALLKQVRPYFARREAIDRLGTYDAVIAHSQPVDPRACHSGHTKWDYRHRVGESKPDRIIRLALIPKQDRAYFETLDDVRAPPAGSAEGGRAEKS